MHASNNPMALSPCCRLLKSFPRLPKCPYRALPKSPCRRSPPVYAVITPRHISTPSDQISSAGATKSFDQIYIHSLKPLIGNGRPVADAAKVEKVEEKQEEESRADVAREESEMEKEAWGLLRKAVVNYFGSPVGTMAAEDPSTASSPLNYDQVFVRDFVPSALAFLLKGESGIVKNFLLHTLQLQSWEKTVDCYSPGQGLMPASFKVRSAPLDDDSGSYEDVLDPDFGEAAIGRVAPVDSGSSYAFDL